MRFNQNDTSLVFIDFINQTQRRGHGAEAVPQEDTIQEK